jgi:hypothetical protein
MPAPNFNFQPHIDAREQWEEFHRIRQAQLGVTTRIAQPNLLDWILALAAFGYDALEKQARGASKTVTSNIMHSRMRLKKAS